MSKVAHYYSVGTLVMLNLCPKEHTDKMFETSTSFVYIGTIKSVDASDYDFVYQVEWFWIDKKSPTHPSKALKSSIHERVPSPSLIYLCNPTQAERLANLNVWHSG